MVGIGLPLAVIGAFITPLGERQCYSGDSCTSGVYLPGIPILTTGAVSAVVGTVLWLAGRTQARSFDEWWAAHPRRLAPSASRTSYGTMTVSLKWHF